MQNYVIIHSGGAMTRKLDIEFGAAELNRDDPLVAEALALGWKKHDEVPGDCMYCVPLQYDESEYSFAGFLLSSRHDMRPLCCVFDPLKWEVELPVFDEDDSWLDPRAKAREAKFYGEEASHAA